MKQKLVIGLMVFAMLAFLLPSVLDGCGGFFGDTPKRPKPISNGVKSPAEPAFNEQGSLVFLNEKDTISQIRIELAETDNKKACGLMFRSQMDHDAGMLFFMEKFEPQNFYMKNTFIPLDIIFLDEAFRIATIAKHTVPYSLQSIPSGHPAKYVLEVNGGYCDQRGITEGMKIAWRPK